MLMSAPSERDWMSKPITSDFAIGQPDGIWIIDAEGKTVFANDSMAQILNTTTVDLIGKDSFLFVFPEDLPSARRLFSAKQAGSSAPFRFKLRRIDGSSIWVDVQGTPMRNALGEFTGVVGTFSVSDVQDL
jgi:PAS domain S-box-containing protein